MKLKHLSFLLMAAMSAPMVAQAAEESPHSVSANVGLTSNYVFRGISQTGGDPAIQGGLDYAHSSGFYLGAWASNVGWIEDFQGYASGNMEIDVYGGYSNSFKDISYDVGAITYRYPGSRAGAVPGDTNEIYASLGWKWFTVKYSYYLSDNVFGFANADGSDYVDISASLPVGETGLTLGAHWGSFTFDNNGNQDYDDWKVSVDYDMGKMNKLFDGMSFGVAYTDTNAKKAFWTDVNGEDLGDGTFIVSISKSF
ncbi:MAG: TorF family putative porin [Pseudomonadota bacterium]